MIPQMGQAVRMDRAPVEETPDQKMVCYKCLLESSLPPEPPAQIVMVGGYSYCIPHARGTMTV